MFVVLGATILLITLLQRYKPKILRTFAASKNLNPKIKGQLYYVTMRRNWLKKRIGRIRKRGFGATNAITLVIRKNKPWLFASMSLKPVQKKAQSQIFQL